MSGTFFPYLDPLQITRPKSLLPIPTPTTGLTITIGMSEVKKCYTNGQTVPVLVTGQEPMTSFMLSYLATTLIRALATRPANPMDLCVHQKQNWRGLIMKRLKNAKNAKGIESTREQ